MEHVTKIVLDKISLEYPLIKLNTKYYGNHEPDIHLIINKKKFYLICIEGKPDNYVIRLFQYKQDGITSHINNYIGMKLDLDKYILIILDIMKYDEYFQHYYEHEKLCHKIKQVNSVALKHLKVDINTNNDVYSFLDKLYDDFNGLSEFHELKDRLNKDDWLK